MLRIPAADLALAGSGNWPSESSYQIGTIEEWVVKEFTDKNGAATVEVVLANEDGTSCRTRIFNSPYDADGNLLPAFEELEDDQLAKSLGGYLSNLTSFLSNVEGYELDLSDEDAIIDIEESIDKQVGYVYLQSLASLAPADFDKDELSKNDKYGLVSRFMTVDAARKQIDAGNAPVDNRPKPWASTGGTTERRARRARAGAGAGATDTSTNGKSEEKPTKSRRRSLSRRSTSA